MSKQAFVSKSTGPRFVGDTFPLAAENGDTFLYTLSNPKSVYVWDGNPGAGRWIFHGYLRDMADAPTGAAGYVGGYNSSAPVYLTKLAFSTDTTSQITSAMVNSKSTTAGASNLTAGWAYGGYDTPSGSPIYSSSIDKLTFSSEAVSTLASALVRPRSTLVAVYSPTHGYVFNGRDTSGVYQTTSCDKHVFASDATIDYSSTIAAGQNADKLSFSASQKGYLYAGSDPGLVLASWVNKLVFATEALTYLGAIAAKSGGWASCSDDPDVAGYGLGQDYYVGGRSAAWIQKFGFTSETASTLTSGISSARAGSGVNSYHGAYAAGGWGSGVGYVTTIDKMRFSTETTASLASGVANANGNTCFQNCENLNV
jgi:hypothetical protein